MSKISEYKKLIASKGTIYDSWSIGKSTPVVLTSSLLGLQVNKNISVSLVPTDVTHLTNKKYVDDADTILQNNIDSEVLRATTAESGLDGRLLVLESDILTKVTKSNSNDTVVYGRKDGAEFVWTLSNDYTDSTIPLRDSNGRIKVGSPNNSYDATNKNYVDTINTNLINRMDTNFLSITKTTPQVILSDITIGDASSQDGIRDLHITGDLYVAGTQHVVDQETITSQSNLIVTNSTNASLQALGGTGIISRTGNQQDPTEAYAVAYYNAEEDAVQLGLGSYNSQIGTFEFSYGYEEVEITEVEYISGRYYIYNSSTDTYEIASGSYDSNETYYVRYSQGQNIATRSRSNLLNNNHLIKWDAGTYSLVDSGKTTDDFVLKIYTSSKLYGTDENGNQTSYDTSLFAKSSDLTNHINNTNNPHSVTKSQVGLGNVVNTGDSAIPIEGGTTKFTTGGAFAELAKKQDNLISGQNIKTINSQSILGSGNAELPSYKQFRSGWRTTGTINNLLEDINSDHLVIVGDVYMGQVSLTDMPFTGTGNIIITVVEQISNSKVLTVMLTSGTVAPYMWTYTYYSGTSSGWISYTLANSPITAGTYTKITYDSKGLVTGGTNLSESDIPTLSKSKISGLQSDLDNKLNIKPNGIDNLIDSNDKINESYIPDSILGQLINGGVITAISGGTATVSLTDAAKYKLGTTSNSINLTNNTNPITGYTANKNIYYVSNTSGTFAGLDIQVGDWLITISTGWSKVDNTDAVSSVNGKTGAVQLQIGDIPGLQNALDAAGQIDDVQINGTSVVTNKVAEITADTTVTENSTNLIQSGAVFNAIKNSEQTSIVMDHAIGSYDGTLTVMATDSATPFGGVSFEVDDTKTISYITIGFGSGSAGSIYVIYDLTNNVSIEATKTSTDKSNVKNFTFANDLTGVNTIGIGIPNAAEGNSFKIKTITVNYADETNQVVTLDEVSAVNSTLNLVDKFVYTNVGLHIPITVYDATTGYELVVEKIVDSNYYTIVSDLPFNAYVLCWNDKYGRENSHPWSDDPEDWSYGMRFSGGFNSSFRQSLDEKHWVGPY